MVAYHFVGSTERVAQNNRGLSPTIPDPGIQPLADQPQYSTIIDPLLDEAP